MRNTAQYSRCCCDGGIAEIHLTVGVSHTPSEVAVGRADGSFASGEDSHVPTQAGAARGGTDDCACLNEDLHQTFAERIQVDLLGPWDNDTANIAVYPPPLENSCCRFKVLQTSVGTGADDGLIDGDIPSLFDRVDVLWEMREGDLGP